MNPMNEELAQLLINLKLKAVAARLDEYLSAAERDGTPLATLLTQLLRAEWQARQQAALAARLKRAQLPETWSLESFPFKLQTGVKERQMRTFAQLEFIPKAENIVFIGETGVGKTGLMSGLVLKAVQNGYRALFMYCLAENGIMMHLARKAGLTVMIEAGEADARLKLDRLAHGGAFKEAMADQFALVDSLLKQQYLWLAQPRSRSVSQAGLDYLST